MSELLTALTTISLLDSTSMITVATVPMIILLSSQRPVVMGVGSNRVFEAISRFLSVWGKRLAGGGGVDPNRLKPDRKRERIPVNTQDKERSMKRMLTVSALIMAVTVAAFAQAGDADREAIEATALDYGIGYYEGDADRMERALHPDLAKRVVFPDPRSGKGKVNHMSALKLVQATRSGSGTKVPAEERKAEVTIMEVYGNVACVKLVMRDWIDFMQMAKLGDRWVIVNVLWEPTPEAKKKWGFPEGF